MKFYLILTVFILTQLGRAEPIVYVTPDESAAAALNELGSHDVGYRRFRDKMQIAVDGRKRAVQNLMSVLDSSQSSNASKRYAAYYLGVLKMTEAVDCLIRHISLVPDRIISGSLGETEASYNNFPAMDALVAIGSPAIPSIIKNLSESDDTKNRGLSLNALCRIENDRDIVQLRLEKALKAEKDSQKQARLQSALKALAEAKF